jgi:hypothetical protein
MNRNQKILLGLVVLLAVTLAYRLSNPFKQDTVDRLTYAPARTVASGKEQTEFQDEELISLALLRSPPRSEVTIRRNLFQPPAATKPPKANDRKSQQPAPPPRPQSPQEKVREHFSSFKTFGSFRHGLETYLFLERGKQVLVVTKGDRIDGRYTILDLTEKSVTISAAEMEAPLKIDFDER